MIINYESAIQAIEEEIKGYTDNPEYKGYALWENIVTGLSKSLYILEEVKRNSSYPKSIKGLTKDELENIKRCIEGKIRDIEKEEKVKIYRVCVDGICDYYSTAQFAKAGMLEEFEKIDDDFDDFNIEIDPIFVPKSELSSYRIIK